MLADRQRIAADLNDHVIQRLFAAGLSLQAVAGLLGPGRATDRILATIADLDRTIGQIRTSIFALQQTPRPPCAGCGRGCSTWPPSRRASWDSTPRCGFPGCSTPCPTPSPRTWRRCCAKR